MDNRIFVADDWGMSPGINDGILRLVNAGLIARVSLMANADYFDYRLDELLQHNLSFSLHLNFTHGRSVSNEDRIPTLIDKSKNAFYSLPVFFTKLYTNRISSVDLCNELEEQILKIKRKSIRCATIEGHHNIHLLTKLFDIIVPTASQYGYSCIRLVADAHRPWPFYFTKLFEFQTKKSFPSSWSKDPVICLGKSDMSSEDAFKKRIESRGDHLVVTHPAAKNDLDSVRFSDKYGLGRKRELLLLEQYIQEMSKLRQSDGAPANA